MNKHAANEFMKGHQYRKAAWGSDKNGGFTIEYKTEPNSDTYDGYFYVGGPEERFKDILDSLSLSQHDKDLLIRGTLNGICYAIGWISCFDTFVRKE
jgi:hypothetical protein